MVHGDWKTYLEKTPQNLGQEVCHSLLAYPSDSALTVGPSKRRHEEVTDRSLKRTETWRPHPGAPSSVGEV